uniref:Transmembrane protein 179B n=1 Tax=Mola mola TaxID=94237 RepID=A0A3Q3X1A9_MOLML
MALMGLLLMLELALYAGCFCCGIVTAVSVTIVQGNFGGRCMLYGHVNYSESLIGVQSATPPSLCHFVSAISVLVAVMCFLLSLYWLYTFCIDREVTRAPVWMNVIVVMSCAFLFFLLISGCVLKVGRDALCSSVINNVPNMTSCESAQTREWASPLKGGRFYNNLQKAETAVWVNFFFWLIIGALVILQRCQIYGSKPLVGGPVGKLFADPSVTAAETEPFFNPPAGQQ